MYLKVSLVLAGIGLGLWGSKFLPKPPAIAQEQVQKCKATVSKVTAKDGTVTESVAFESAGSQSQKAQPVSIPNDFLSAGGYGSSAFKAGLSATLKLGSWTHSVESDLDKDHRYKAEKVLLTW